MKARHKITLTAAVVLSLATAAFAMTRPAEMSGTINATKPYGSGSLTRLFLTVYDANLWTDAPQWSMDEPFALTLVYRMSFSTEELVDSTIDQIQAMSPRISGQTLTHYRAVLTRVLPPVKSGHRITVIHSPRAQDRFFHNGRPTGDSQDAAFSEHFFAIWLSPKTPEPSLREGLLRLLGQR